MLQYFTELNRAFCYEAIENTVWMAFCTFVWFRRAPASTPDSSISTSFFPLHITLLWSLICCRILSVHIKSKN